MNTRAQILLRLPATLKQQVQEQAHANHRTVTGEIIAILESAVATHRRQRDA